MIKIKKLDKKAIIPKYQTEGSAGFDFHSINSYILAPGETKLIKTGLAIELPIGFELQIRSRSGLALKEEVFVLNSPGTIDSDYRDEIGIILCNKNFKSYMISEGDRIAQGVIAKYEKVEFEEVSELSTTDRVGGFGSTDKKIKNMKKETIEVDDELYLYLTKKYVTKEDCKEVEEEYKFIKEKINRYDLDKQYEEREVIFQRLCDDKFFSFEYIHSPYLGSSIESHMATEVFPIQKIIIVYE